VEKDLATSKVTNLLAQSGSNEEMMKKHLGEKEQLEKQILTAKQ
jgi:hypothetical protein